MRTRHLVQMSAVAWCVAGLGCGERVTLSDSEGWLEIEYRCAAIEPQARSSAERALIREYAGRILFQASRDQTFDAMRPLLDADSEDHPGGLERVVVDYLCRGVAIAPRATVDSARATTRVRGLDVHVPAPDFIAPLLDSAYLAGVPAHLRLADFHGEYVILNFWSTWCGPCREKHPGLVELSERYADRGVRVVGVLHREGASIALRWLEKNPAGRYVTVVDEDGRIAQLYDVDGIPHVYLIDREGQIVSNSLAISPDSLALRLDALLGA